MPPRRVAPMAYDVLVLLRLFHRADGQRACGIFA